MTAGNSLDRCQDSTLVLKGVFVDLNRLIPLIDHRCAGIIDLANYTGLLNFAGLLGLG